MEAANIKPINHNSVHKICSGQVVLTLASAVKELIENSIDAGATIIEVKLKEYGTKLIEVIDNGKGVKASDFQSITLKHHTSKISDFSDVEFVSTFGFRGEALSSLCALSNVEIITCHNDSAVGSLLVYDHDGTLVKSSSTPRQIGTTVILKDLFFTLPVRHREFHRNIRREYAKMIQLLSAYCLISVNKRITCTNITDKGRKTIVLSTNSSDNLKDNITCIFGSKQVNNLMKFVQHAPSESVLEEYFLPQSVLEKCRLFCLEGYISSSAHQEGRSATDRQFFFINGRPCDLYKISKLINEVYHFYNKAQYPFVFLNIILNEGSVDVNVTPDKRQIFIPNEKLLLCIVKSSLYQMYQLQSSQIKVSPASPFFQKSSLDISHKFPVETENQLPTLSQTTEKFMKRKAGSHMDGNEDENLFSPPFKSLRKDELNQYVKEKSEQLEKDHPVNIQDSSDSGILCMEITSPSSPSYAALGELKSESPKNVKKDLSQVTGINIALTLPFNEEKAFRNTSHSGSLNLKDILQKSYRGNNILNCNVSNKGSKRNKQKMGFNEKIINFFSKTSSKSLNVCGGNEDPKPSVAYVKATSNSYSEVLIPGAYIVDSMENDEALDKPHMRRKKIKTITFSIEAIRKSLDTKNETNLTESISYRKFRSKIAPTENHSAEEELKKEIKKENFSQMSIIGQFNLGFIVTRLNDDLFIIDQHATDEKYNFEMLQKEIVPETQLLLNPQNLNLTAVSEAVLLDNLHIFERSGFKFSVDEDNSIGNKIQLISVPVNHNWRFGKEDVDEMIFMLTDNPVSMVRPSRVNQMFASRACRKSVMIGTALTISMMKKLVIHMGEIEQPWNCPHGRPTIRHLFNLNLLKSAANE